MRILQLNKQFLICVCLLLNAIYFIAQTPDSKRADDLFKFKNYRDALTEYVELFKKNTKGAET